jgi:hypothetical protein
MHERSNTAGNREVGWARRPFSQPPWQLREIIHQKVQLERELGRPICGYRVGGDPRTLEPGNEGALHNGDYEQGGSSVG